MCLGEVVRLDAVSGSTGTGRINDRALTVSLITLEEPVRAGDWVVVHSGFALRRLEPDEAADALSLRADDPSGPTDRTTPRTTATTPVQEKA